MEATIGYGSYGERQVAKPPRTELTPDIAAGYLRRAGGNREQAKKMAAQDGYIE